MIRSLDPLDPLDPIGRFADPTEFFIGFFIEGRAGKNTPVFTPRGIENRAISFWDCFEERQESSSQNPEFRISGGVGQRNYRRNFNFWILAPGLGIPSSHCCYR